MKVLAILIRVAGGYIAVMSGLQLFLSLESGPTGYATDLAAALQLLWMVVGIGLLLCAEWGRKLTIVAAVLFAVFSIAIHAWVGQTLIHVGQDSSQAASTGGSNLLLVVLYDIGVSGFLDLESHSFPRQSVVPIGQSDVDGVRSSRQTCGFPGGVFALLIAYF